MRVQKCTQSVYNNVHDACTPYTYVVFGSIVLPINSNKQTNNGRLHVSENTGKQVDPCGQRGDIADDQKTRTIGGPHAAGPTKQMVCNAEGPRMQRVLQRNSQHGHFNISFRLLELGVVSISVVRFPRRRTLPACGEGAGHNKFTN